MIEVKEHNRHRTVTGCSSLDSALTLNEHFDALPAKSSTNEAPVTVFQSVLGSDFNLLPKAVQELHKQTRAVTYYGIATSTGANGITGRITAFLFGFPGTAQEVPITVELLAEKHSERWRRTFAGSTFTSRLSRDEGGYMQERFGPMHLELGLKAENGELHHPVTAVRLLGIILLPKQLLPISTTRETVDEQGRFTFDVEVLTPFVARVAHYTGWLVKMAEATKPL